MPHVLKNAEDKFQAYYAQFRRYGCAQIPVRAAGVV
jgi:hypothetical protein